VRQVHQPASTATALLGICTTDPLRQQSHNVLADVKILHLYFAAVNHVHYVVDRNAANETTERLKAREAD